MAIFKAIVWALAVVWVAGVLSMTRHQLRYGEPVSPPMFALGMMGLLLLGTSPLHLL